MELRPYYDRPYHTSCKNMKQTQLPNGANRAVSSTETRDEFRDIVSYMYNSDCYCYNELTQVLPGKERALFVEVLLGENAEQCHVFGTKCRYRIRRRIQYGNVQDFQSHA